MPIKIIILWSLIALVAFLFAFSLFKNIGFPLLWQDEAETAMFSQRVLQFGYPKVDDGKNYLYFLELPDKTLGVRKSFDAYLGHFWGQFYFGTIGEFLAQKTNDLYLKTAFLRFPYTVIGLAGLIIFLLTILQIVKLGYGGKLSFIIGYIFLNLLSVSLILHLKEVRYYSLVIFLQSSLFYLYFNYLKSHRWSSLVPLTLIFILLLLTFTFPPAFFAGFLFLTIDLIRQHFKTISINLSSSSLFYCFKTLEQFILKSFWPLIISLILALPLFWFFETFRLNSLTLSFYQFNWSQYFANIIRSLTFFAQFEFLYLAVFLKVVVWFFLWLQPSLGSLLGEAPAEAKTKNNLFPICRISDFLSLFFIIYLLVVARNPFIFERYLVNLIPILNAIILLDLLTMIKFFSPNKCLALSSAKKTIFWSLVLLLFLTGFWQKKEALAGRVYELTHQYKGPLDFVIPYLKEKYPKTENLILATNYEEGSLMYYLNSQVIVGYAGGNLENDLKLTPDIIIMRKDRTNYTDELQTLLAKANYQRKTFPVYDYQFNNIPELSLPLPHLYQTPLAYDKSQQLTIYEKIN